jgi:hypothetical protein
MLFSQLPPFLTWTFTALAAGFHKSSANLLLLLLLSLLFAKG